MAGMAFAISQSAALRAEPALAAIDLFGTSQITLEEVEARVGESIREMVRLHLSEPEQARSLRDEVIATVKTMGDFAWVGLGAIPYSRHEIVYVTVDVVDAADRQSRMPFKEPPSGEEPREDPAGLVAAMAEYLAIGRQLMMAGESSSRRAECPAYHCVFGFEHPRLREYEDRFERDVPEHRSALASLLDRSPDALQRAMAAYLLAYLEDGDDVVELLLPAVVDPNAGVRNNAMRVLAFIASSQPEVDIPIPPIATALRYPATTDRNKAAAILFGLANRGEDHEVIARRAGPALLEILRLEQPNNHDFAYRILRQISGEAFGDRDYEDWERWLKQRYPAQDPV